MSEESQIVIQTTDERFETDVIIRSQLGLVIVDFWAEWCAPCRMLTPVLEKLAAEYADRVTLVKANTDENSRAAQQFGVAGIPAVFAVLNEKVIDAFQGALPEPAARAWLEQCLQADSILRVQQLIESDPAQAEARLREMIAESPSDETKVALLQALFRQGKEDECRQLLEQLSERGFLEPECEKIQAELELKQHAHSDLATIRASAEKNPDDLAAQLALAEALAGDGQYQAAFEICLMLVERDRQRTGEQARQLMVDVFRVLGDEAELTREYRRRLSMVLY